MRHQQGGPRTFARLLGDRSIQVLDLITPVVVQRLKLVTTVTGVARQRPRCDHGVAIPRPQPGAASYPLAQRDGLQCVLHLRSQPRTHWSQ
jgi:hypothetical protein